MNSGVFIPAAARRSAARLPARWEGHSGPRPAAGWLLSVGLL